MSKCRFSLEVLVKIKKTKYAQMGKYTANFGLILIIAQLIKLEAGLFDNPFFFFFFFQG